MSQSVKTGLAFCFSGVWRRRIVPQFLPWSRPFPFLHSARRKPFPMAQKDYTILNKLGIHARPAAQFVKTANRFQSDIFVEKDGEEVDGKSIMGLMMLAAGNGSVISISADGSDADAALEALGDLISRKFEED
jgi:phosphotransferase system HPr (HPr) family protein